MSTVTIPIRVRRALQSTTWWRNGSYPYSGAHRALHEDINHLLYVRTKCVGSWRVPISSTPASTDSDATTLTRWRFAYHSSSHAKELWVMFEFMKAGQDTAGGETGNPFAKLLVELADGTDVGTVVHNTGTSDDDGDEIFKTDTWGTSIRPLRDTNDAVVTLTPNTDYFGTFSDNNGSRIVAVHVFERAFAADTTNGYLPQNQATGGPIFDEDRGDAVTLLRTAWKRNGKQIFNWSSHRDSAVVSRISSTAANWIDQTVATASSTSPGLWADLQNCATIRQLDNPNVLGGSVPCRLFVYAAMTTATGGKVQLRDSSNNLIALSGLTAITITSTTNAWYSATCDLPASLAKYDVFVLGNGGADAIKLFAACLAIYEA